MSYATGRTYCDADSHLMETPDWLKGRVLAVQSIFISCSNQLGAVESGWTAAWFGAVFSVVGGGVATILVVTAFAAGAGAMFFEWRPQTTWSWHPERASIH